MEAHMQLSGRPQAAAARVAARMGPPPQRLQLARPHLQQLHSRRATAAAHRRRAQRLVAVKAQQQQLPTLEDTLPPDFEEVAFEVKEALQGTSLYLVGMMGSGKSTVGRVVARALRYSFFDTDTLIEQLTGTTIPQIFASEGEGAFRDVETQVLQELAPFKECVVATGGGIVTRGVNWGHMQHGIVVWLSGSPELLAARVVGDGTANRPLLSQQQQQAEGEQQQEQQQQQQGGSEEYDAAVKRLTALLDERRKQYEFSDIEVPLEGEDGPHTGAAAGIVAYRILDAIRNRIKSDAEMREDRKNFTIEDSSSLPNMRVVESPAAQDPFLP